MTTATATTDTVWFQQAARLAAFVSSENRMPNTHSADSDERQIGDWLKRVRSAATMGITLFTPDRRQYLDANAPNWLPDRHARWKLNLQALAAFKNER